MSRARANRKCNSEFSVQGQSGMPFHSTCIESALIISPLYLPAISKASLDFPAPVDPKITTTGSLLMEAAMILNILDWLHSSVLFDVYDSPVNSV